MLVQVKTLGIGINAVIHVLRCDNDFNNTLPYKLQLLHSHNQQKKQQQQQQN